MSKTFREGVEEYNSPIEWLKANIDDDSEYWEPIEYIGSYALFFIHQLLKERNKVIQDIKIGVHKEDGSFDKEATEHLHKTFWDKQNVQEQIEKAFRISGWEGKAALTFLPTSFPDMPIALNVPTSVPRVEFFGEKLLWIDTIQSFQKGTMVDVKQNEYALEQRFSEGNIKQNFSRTIENTVAITGETFSKNVSKIQANRYPVSTKKNIDLKEKVLPAIYFEDYPMMNKLGLPIWYEIDPLLKQLDILHIERYLYTRYNGNKIKISGFDGDEEAARTFIKEVRDQIRKNYITHFGDYDNYDGEWEWEGADYEQLEKIDNAIERLEKKIANLVGLEWIYSKDGSYNSTKGETDRLANQQNVIGQNRKWVKQIKNIAEQVVEKYIALSQDQMLIGKDIKVFLKEVDYSTREFIREKGLDFKAQGIISGAEIREVLFGEAPWEAQEKVEANIEAEQEVQEKLNPEPEPTVGGDNAKD